MTPTNMTEGKITPHLVKYALPLIAGNLFQLTYNAVDSIIAGRFIGKEALAAEGTASPVMNLVILGISGICMGASVLMSEFFGAGRHDLVKKEMATTTVFGLYFSLAVAFLGAWGAGPLLELLNVSGDLLELASKYLSIIFLGAPFTYFYNAISAALKSLGDSKTPLKFLMFSSILNAVLDLIFIGGLGFGIVCSAVTTVAAEAVSALLCIWYVYTKIPMLRLSFSEFTIDRELLKKTLRYGSITALQQSCQPIGKILIQGVVNSMGVSMIAAFHAVSRIDDYAFTPEQSISHAITTFVAQNRGAGRYDRLRAGFRRGMFLEAGYWVLICSLVLLLKEPLVGLFVPKSDVQVIGLGTEYLSLMAFFYLFPAFTNGIQGYFRGMGKMTVTLMGTVIQTSVRVVGVCLLTPYLGIRGIAVACAAGWSLMLLAEVPYYFFSQKRERAEVGRTNDQIQED